MKLLHNVPGYGSGSKPPTTSLVTFVDDNYTEMWNTRIETLAKLTQLDYNTSYQHNYLLQDLPILAEGFTTIDELRQIVPELFI